MTPARTGTRRGNFQFDRVFPGVGRVRCSSGTQNLREFRRRDAVLTKLFETAQLDVLRAFQRRELTIEQLIAHDRHGYVGEPLVALRARQPLWETFEALLPKMGRKAGTRARYALSMRQLRKRGGLGDDAVVADLQHVDWHRLQREWDRSPADWNRLRTAVSRFCTLFAGDKFSPFRRELMARFPLAQEPEGRLPDLTPAQFLAILERIRDDAARSALMLVALTGLRIGEYLSLDESCLMPGYRRIRIPRQEGNKTGGTITVSDETWAWVVAAVPFAGRPVPAVPYRNVASDPRYRRLWRAWRPARDAEGVGDITLHDLRHCAGQWASEAGTSDGAIGQLLRHSDPRMTARYTRQKDATTANAAVVRALNEARRA